MNIQINKSKNIGKISIAGEEYDIYIAKSKEQKEKGLQFFEDLPLDEGMLFVNKTPEDCWYHMKNVSFPIDLIGMDEDFKVVQIHHGKPNDETPMNFKNVMYVLEINPNEKIKEGDEADMDDEETNEYVMKVLDSDGKMQAGLFGGERIFSRKSTKTIIRKALKAFYSKEDKDYKALGKYVFKELKAQDTRPAEFVNSPK